jgi:hypothetical protein
MFRDRKQKNQSTQLKKAYKKKNNIPITTFESCHSQQQTPPIIEACNSPQIRPLFIFFNCKRRGGYPEVPFRTILVTALPRSFNAVADFQQKN